MNTLVTGGGGFVGSNLVQQLLRRGHDVTVLDDFSSGFRSNLVPFPQVRIVEGDVRDEAAVWDAVQGAEVVFHLAASVGNKRSIDNPVVDAEINCIGTLRLLDAMRRAKSRRIVTSSSAGIFGELKSLPIDEGHPAEPDTPYGCSKLYEEKVCMAYARLYGLEAVCLRYFNVYGPRQRFDAYGNVIPIFVFEMLRGKPLVIFGDGEQTRDFVNVKDVVEANILSAVTPGLTGIFNIGSGRSISINALVEKICEASGERPLVLHGPPRPGDVRHSLADIRSAETSFGFNPSVSLEEGLVEYIAWARTESLGVR